MTPPPDPAVTPSPPPDTSALTEDRFDGGRLVVRQYRNGYRFSVDAILLATFAAPWAGRTLVEFGTGCGIVSLLLASRLPDVRIDAIDIQPLLAELAAGNVGANALGGRVTVHCRDLKTVSAADFGAADSIVCNPPFYPLGTGRLNPDDQRAQARHELRATLTDVIAAARRTLKKSGSLVMIYPAERTGELLATMRVRGIEPKLLQCVHAYADGDAQMVLVRGRLGVGTGMTVAAPLVLYHRDGSYTDAAAEILVERKSTR